jgi:hypothetical protein
MVTSSPTGTTLFNYLPKKLKTEDGLCSSQVSSVKRIFNFWMDDDAYNKLFVPGISKRRGIVHP